MLGAASRSRIPVLLDHAHEVPDLLFVDDRRFRLARLPDLRQVAAGQVILPGMKHRTEISPLNSIGQTIVRPARFGSVIKASSGTSIHSP